MLELILSSTRSTWQMPAHHGTEQDASSPMKDLRKKILERDDYTCQFCGFKALKWQEIHHIDQDHQNNSTSNLATSCPFCHQCFHLGMAGTTSGGQIIWLPEMTQVELNHLVRALFVASLREDQDNKMHQSANILLQTLSSRAMFVEQNLAAGSSDPAALGQAFLKMSKKDYDRRKDFIKNLRLLPLKSRFSPQIKYWYESTFKDLNPNSWDKLMKKI